MRAEEWIEGALADLRAAGLERQLRPVPQAGGRLVLDGRDVLNFGSNDYLGLARHPDVVAMARRRLEEAGTGAGASRLVSGTQPWHLELEQALAAFKGNPAALVFGSGYLANIGLIPAVVGREDAVWADRLAHASLLDAAVLSRARLQRFAHNDPDQLDRLLKRSAARKGRRLVITESVFSMDGDVAPLRDLARVAAEHGAMLLVDEAHATGVFGPGGAGRVRAEGLESEVHLSMGTLSKALGGYGGFVACTESMREWLIQRSRAFIYTTALPPAVIGSALGALQVLARQPGMGGELLGRADFFRRRLQAAGVNTGDSASQIIPVMVGENRRALALAERLRGAGILVPAIRPPTVPEGTARLRFSLSLVHTRGELETAADRVVQAMRDEGLL